MFTFPWCLWRNCSHRIQDLLCSMLWSMLVIKWKLQISKGRDSGNITLTQMLKMTFIRMFWFFFNSEYLLPVMYFWGRYRVKGDRLVPRLLIKVFFKKKVQFLLFYFFSETMFVFHIWNHSSFASWSKIKFSFYKILSVL